jgi:branched-chain amino acid transport system substrate-binding protein
MHEKTGRQYMKKNKVIALAVAAGLVAASAVALAPASNAADTVKIAFQGPLTGPEAQTGTDEVRGVKLALKLYNATNPAVKVELVEVDDQGDPAIAGTVAPGVAKDTSIIGMVGAAYSGATIASLPSYKAAPALAMISPSATRPSLTDPASPDYGQPVFHRIVSNDALQGPALVRVATKGVAKPAVYVVDDQSSYATGLRDVVVPTIGDQGIKWLVGTDSVVKGTTDFSAVIAKIKKVKANVVIYTGYYADGAKFAKQLRDKGYKGVLAGGDGVLNSAFIKLAGTKAATGYRFTAPTTPLDIASPKLTATFKKEFGADPGVYTTEAYDAANMFLTAIKAGKTNRADVLAFVKTLKYKNTAGVTISFNKNGDLNGAGLINAFEVKGGKIVLTGLA